MKSFNHKCIKVCLSMKVSLLYISIDYHSLSLTDDAYYFTYSTTRGSVSHYINQMAFQCYHSI